MKFAFTSLLLFSSICLTAPGQEIKLAVVDMQRALNSYYKTQQEVEQINELGEEKIRNIDERKAAYQKMTSEMVELDKTVRAVELSEEKRKAAAAKLEILARDRVAKANEIGAAERKASQELMDARQKMEDKLIGEIRVVASELAEAKGIDLLLDKSFLPKASKLIIHTSPKLVEITDEVVAKLNASSPGGN